MCNGVTSIRAHNKIGQKIVLTVRRFYPDTADSLTIEKQIGHFMLHFERERWKFFCLLGKEIQEIPLRHKTNELAVGRQMGEVRQAGEVTVEVTIEVR